ncbi:general secretion pathway protein GspK [Candidatus Poribacteria bacterium]|nr:general secretion pathway protein GspK [Candidatus Poribacteria bacterium]
MSGLLAMLFPHLAPPAVAGQKRRSVVLILVLWISVILTLMAYSVLYQMTLETRLTSTRKKTLVAKSLARAGVARAFTDLRNDLIFDFSDETKEPFDAEGDVWMDPAEENIKAELGDGTYSVRVADEERLFDLNAFKGANRVLLQKIIEYVGYEEADAKIAASAIIDFADADNQAVLDSAPGREGFAYAVLQGEDEGGPRRESEIVELRFPDEPYLTIEQLLDVYGVTPELYFGPGTPEAEYYREKLGPRRGDRFKINEQRRSRAGKQKAIGLRDFFTVSSSKRLNINTAPEHVLSALFTAAGASDGDRMAENVIRKRRGGRTRRIDNDDAFKTAAEIQQSAEIGGLLGPIQSLYQLNTRSGTFTVTSTGTFGGAIQTLQVTVSRNLATMRRDENFEQIDRARERQQRYEDRRERRRDRNDEQVVRIPNVRIINWSQP